MDGFIYDGDRAIIPSELDGIECEVRVGRDRTYSYRFVDGKSKGSWIEGLPPGCSEDRFRRIEPGIYDAIIIDS